MIELYFAAVVAACAMAAFALWRHERGHDEPVRGGEELLVNGVQAALSKPPPGVEERRGDQQAIADVVEGLALLRAEYARFGKRMMRAVAIVAIGVFAAVGVGGLALDDAHDASEDATQNATEVRRLTEENLALAEKNRALIERLDVVAARADREADRSTDALCALRGDLARRVRRSEDFLRDNPAGIPGVPVAALRQSVGDLRHTIKALSPLRCR